MTKEEQVLDLLLDKIIEELNEDVQDAYFIEEASKAYQRIKSMASKGE